MYFDSRVFVQEFPTVIAAVLSTASGVGLSSSPVNVASSVRNHTTSSAVRDAVMYSSTQVDVTTVDILCA